MSAIQIRLPDNSIREFDHQPTILEVAESIGPKLAKDTIGGLIDGDPEVRDLRTVLKDGQKLEILTMGSEKGLEVVRHSAAHVMAQAVQEIWPEVKATIGPVIDNGFYYDFDSPFQFTPEHLSKIEKKMKEIIKRGDKIEKQVLERAEAEKTFKSMDESYKLELIEGFDADSEISIYKQGGDWFDLCRGPHVQKTSQIKAVKVLSLAGSYWRGDENRQSLQRVYATAFYSQKDLDEHLKNLEEAKKRDHRKLGKELGMFYFDQLSPGGPFFTPKGTIVYNEFLDFLREKYRKYDYQEVITPQVYDVDLYKQSGHYQNYKENMYFMEVDDRQFSLKPMNCPGHCVLYTQEKKSYRDLPWRVADFGRLHRYERSGVMHGLTRVRTFSQDDGHIFCTLDQMQSEIESFVSMFKEIYHALGMEDYKIYLSTRPEKRMGSDEVWDKAEAALENALQRMELPFQVNPGDGAFYGPKLDFMFVDALKRPWQLGTLQADFNLPEAFDLSYVGDDNSEHRPVMLHRAILGSLERFIGVYLEHTAGHLPTWLMPQQVRVMNLTDRQLDYCKSLTEQLKAEGLRVDFDDRSEKLGFKIREAQLMKIPYMLVIGDKEEESGQISVRLKNGTTKYGLKMEDFVSQVKKDVGERMLKSPLIETES
ncbi:MAG: threonine--tRNA ligase [Bdellovibrionales bacterium]|nr:threonine--tRNA ligase [Bdellovibrionales bacterium]